MKDFHQRMDAIERRILKRLREQTERNDHLRARVMEEIAQFIENEPIHSWIPGILAKRIRALSAHKEGKPERKSMTETLMDPDEKKFWDAADRQDDEQDTGSGK